MSEESVIQKLLRKEVEKSKTLGVDEAVKATKEELYRYVGVEETRQTAMELRRKAGIKKRKDLEAVFKVLR